MWDPARKFYDWTAPVYGWWAFLTESKAHRIARARLQESPGESLLEVAVGTGSEIVHLTAESACTQAVGIDLSMAMLRQTRRRIRKAGGIPVALCRADARALPFADRSFDRILNNYMIDLLPDNEIPLALAEYRRVLRPGGLLVVLTMARQRAPLQYLWMTLFRHAPLLVGACRPVEAERWLAQAGWRIEHQERIEQLAVFTDLFAARPA
jgi:ubiquinone/menaquinone biosynthesis C-methylase UbiE